MDGSGRPVKAANKPLAYEYNDERIKRDESVSYKSEKYPWLEAVHKYPILSHQPHDYEHLWAARLQVQRLEQSGRLMLLQKRL